MPGESQARQQVQGDGFGLRVTMSGAGAEFEIFDLPAGMTMMNVAELLFAVALSIQAEEEAANR